MLTPFLSLVITTLDELLKSENICPKIPQQLLFMLSSPADWTTATHFCTVVTRASRKQGRIPPDYTQTVYTAISRKVVGKKQKSARDNPVR